MYNHYTSTHPRSPFTGQVVALRTEPDIRHALRGRKLTITRPDGVSEGYELRVEELPGVLTDLFGIELAAEEHAGLQRAAA